MRIQITDDFNMEKIAQSGQCFRWYEVKKDMYRIIHLDKCLYIERTAPDEYDLDCDEGEYEAVWKDYFDLGENYGAIRARIERTKDAFLSDAIEHEKGIRILRQVPWEALVSFIISQNRNIPAIRLSIEHMSRMAGERRTDSRGKEYNVFPAPEAVVRLSEADLCECSLGYRWKYVKAAAEAVVSGRLDLQNMKEKENEEILHSLTALYGVGEKVASCVLLFGFHQLDGFPVDVWMKRILAEEYPQGYPFLEYSPYNGVYQQYMFAYYRNRGSKSMLSQRPKGETE